MVYPSNPDAKTDSLAVLRLNRSAAKEAGIQPQKAPSNNELEMNPIQFPLGSSTRSMVSRNWVAGRTPAMTPRSWLAKQDKTDEDHDRTNTEK
jgi:hypothetical protein